MIHLASQLICWDIEHYMENEGNIDHSIENTDEIYAYRCENHYHDRKTLLKAPIIVHYQKVWVFWKVESEPVHVLTTPLLCLYFFVSKSKHFWKNLYFFTKTPSWLISESLWKSNKFSINIENYKILYFSRENSLVETRAHKFLGV